jgi:signal recognition particle receptor subunit beta
MPVIQPEAWTSQADARAVSAGLILTGKTTALTTLAQTMPITISSIRTSATSKTLAGAVTVGSATIGSV